MIRQMTKYSFVIFHKDVPGFLKMLQELGVMDVTRSSKPATEHSREVFGQLSRIKSAEKTLQALEKEAAGIEKASSVLSASEIVADVERLTSETASLKEQIKQEKKLHEEAIPWGDFSHDTFSRIEALGLNPVLVCIPAKKYSDKLKEEYALEVISATQDKVYAVILQQDGLQVKDKFKVLERPERPASEIDQSIAGLEADLKSKSNDLLALCSQAGTLKAESDRLAAQADLLLAGESSIKEAESTIEVFTGFAPAEMRSDLCAKLDAQDGLYYIAEDAKVEDNPPIALKNNWFTRMFAVLTDLYGRPVYNEFDPTPYISVFFMLFFAMCMGDAGYGLVLIIISFLLRKSEGARKFAPLVLTLGIATAVVGFVLHTFFGIDLSQVSWIPDSAKKFMITGTIAGYDAQMLLSLAIGVLHICVALVVKAVYAVRKNGLATSIGTIGWTVLIVGGVILLAFTLLTNMSSSLTKILVIALGIVSALSIFFFSNLRKNPLVNFGNGMWETYITVTGLLGDVLSYIRLYALGLAGGMLGAAFNQLAGMLVEDTHGFSASWIFFVLIVVLGHVLNLAMCCLGAFVHPLRLNFLEFFKNSGYEGSGKKYNPLTINNNN